MTIWGLLFVAATVVSPVVFLTYGAFPAFVLLAAAVLVFYLGVLRLVLEYDAALDEHLGRLKSYEERLEHLESYVRRT